MGYVQVIGGDGGGVDVVFGAVPVVVEGVAGVPVGAALSPRSGQDYQDALAALLPSGAAWDTSRAAVLMEFLAGLAQEFSRLDARAVQLTDEAVPSLSLELLGDWERVIGLPDPCVERAQTVEERRRALAGRLSAGGVMSRAFFVDLAWRLGYEVSIEEFTSAAAATLAGVSFAGDEWAHIWRMSVAQSIAVTPFRVGAGSVGEPLRTWGNEVLECQVNRYKPAHTRVLFAYAA